MSAQELKAVEALVSVLLTTAPEVAASYKYGELRGRCRAFLRRLRFVRGREQGREGSGERKPNE